MTNKKADFACFVIVSQKIDFDIVIYYFSFFVYLNATTHRTASLEVKKNFGNTAGLFPIKTKEASCICCGKRITIPFHAKRYACKSCLDLRLIKNATLVELQDAFLKSYTNDIKEFLKEIGNV